MKHCIGGAQYYIIYIDDCTRYTEVYFLITKKKKKKTAEEISAKFQHYQAWVETHGFHFKHFRSNNGSGKYNIFHLFRERRRNSETAPVCA